VRRVIQGNAHASGKIVSLFEPHTEIIRKGKASKPTEFGKMVKIQEAESQIITHYEVYDERPSDSQLLIPAIKTHQDRLRRAPRLVTADAAFFSSENESAAMPWESNVCRFPTVPPRARSARRSTRKRWFRNAQKWRTGSEGRISVGETTPWTQSLSL